MAGTIIVEGRSVAPAPSRPEPETTGDADPATHPVGVPRARWISAVATLVVLVIAGGAWLAYSAFNRPLTITPDVAELRALDARLTRIEDAVRPIAEAFTSQSSTSPIDVDAYAARVASLRSLVDSTNDLPASTPDTLEIRDTVLTGGSQIVDGMTQALDALRSDDPSATVPAASLIDEGLSNLQQARTLLDAALGRVQPV